MASASMTIRMDRDVKQRAQALFARLGMDMTTAVNVFIRQALEYGGLPFALRCRGVTEEIPNADTVAAFAEGDRMLDDPKAPRFDSIDALFEDLES